MCRSGARSHDRSRLIARLTVSSLPGPEPAYSLCLGVRASLVPSRGPPEILFQNMLDDRDNAPHYSGYMFPISLIRHKDPELFFAILAPVGADVERRCEWLT